MSKLFLSEPVTILKDGQEITLTGPVYNISDEKLMKANGLFKCHKCKDYFDTIMEFGFPTDEQKNKTWCESHFPG